jgi:hypothetical protein
MEERRQVSLSSVHLREALSAGEVDRFRALWREEMRGYGKTVILEPGERVEVFGRPHWQHAPSWSPSPLPPLPWFYRCDPMILLAVIAAAVMGPIALIILATNGSPT